MTRPLAGRRVSRDRAPRDHGPRVRGPAFLAVAARAREGRHRRLLLLGIGALLLLSLTPVVGQHLFGAAHGPLSGIDHIGAVCLIALHELLAPVHAGLHLLVAAGFFYAGWERARAWRRAHRALGPLPAVMPVRGDAFWTAARAVGLDPRRVRVVAGLPTPAFTAGWRAPLVYVTRALADGPAPLAPGELAAVLAHEDAHRRRRDPLRFSALRAMATTLFWLPALRRLADDVADEAEVRADDAAAARTDPLTVASALVRLAAWRAPGALAPHGSSRGPSSGSFADGYAVGFVRPDLLDRRVRRLLGENTAPASRVTRTSLATAALALAVVGVSGVVDVHALPHGAHAPGSAAVRVVSAVRHCDHARLAAVWHLFCRRGVRGAWITPGGADCPHRDAAAGRTAAGPAVGGATADAWSAG